MLSLRFSAVAFFFIFVVASLYAGSPATCVGSSSGGLRLLTGDDPVCEFRPSAFDRNWKLYYSNESSGADADVIPFRLMVGQDAVDGSLKASMRDGSVDAFWTFSSSNGFRSETLGIRADLDVSELQGASFSSGSGKAGSFPESVPANPNFFRDEASSFSVAFPNGKALNFDFQEPMRILLVDVRAWGGSSYGLCIQRLDPSLKANEPGSIRLSVSYSDGISYRKDSPLRIVADSNWVPLKDELDIVPGSALDLSGLGFTDGPCGSKGRVIVTPDGHFAFEKEPSIPRRFYGVNFGFNSQYLSKERARALLDRVARLGYNAIRVHHYDCMLTHWQPGFNWDMNRLDQLDYFMAEASKRGLWITTDLFVTRIVSGKQLGLNDSAVSYEKFKALIPVYEPAFRDWAKFARMFLDRVNPYTGLRVADDPAVAWISLVNEDSASSYSGIWDAILTIPEWKASWNAWLLARYPERSKLASALGDLAANEDPAANSVALPQVIWADSNRARAAQVFAAEIERAAYARMRDFLRNEIKCPALLTGMNDSGSSCLPLQAVRGGLDYVDEHFYVDHPVFLGKGWSLPSRSPNANPIRRGGAGAFRSECAKLYGKPFTVSEYSYAAPSPFRGIGGVLTASLGSLHDWDAFWRFTYSSSLEPDAKDEFEPSPAVYFDLSRDPLSQASDRLALLLFLRRDLKPAPHQLGLLLPSKQLQDPTIRASFAGFASLGWSAGVCGVLADDGASLPSNVIAVPYGQGASRAAVLSALANAKIEIPKQSFRSETGELSLDPANSVFRIDAPRSGGGYAPAGGSLDAPSSGVRVSELTAGATVFVNSLDLSPIRSAKRILITHLTDLQNSNCLFAESSRQTLLEWGSMPHLVRDGSASVRIALDEPGAYSVWALSPGGRRVERIPCQVQGTHLVFTASVRGQDGARMLYEAARQ